MITFSNTKKIAILDKDENAVIKQEDTLRIVSMYIDYIKREARFVLYRGFQEKDKIFTISNPENIIVVIRDEPGKELFTQLTTPKTGQESRWAGDFRLADAERIMIDEQMLPDLQDKTIKEQK